MPHGVAPGRHLPEGAVGRQPGTGAGRGAGGGHRAGVEEIARVRHEHMVGEPSGPRDAERARRRAEVLVAAVARRAPAASDPRVHDAALADRHAGGPGTAGDDDAGDLVAEGERQIAAPGQIEAAPVSEVEVAVGEVQVAVADPARLDRQQHLVAGGLRAGVVPAFQRRPIAGQLVAAHGGARRAPAHRRLPGRGCGCRRLTAVPWRKKVGVPRTAARHPSDLTCASRSSGRW